MKYLVVLVIAMFPTFAFGQSLKGSRGSVQKMYRESQEHDYTPLANKAMVRKFVKAGILVELKGNKDYSLSGVPYPYVRPNSKLFVERFARQYHKYCEQKLVVTSGTRTLDLQPRNASKYSVHPMSIAIDLRVPRGPRCKSWLERNLLSLENSRVVEVTRESRPAHYHIAIFPEYRSYVDAKRKPPVAKAKLGPKKKARPAPKLRKR